MLVSLIDRYSRRILIGRSRSREKIEVTKTLNILLSSVNPNDLKTITPD